MGLSPFRIVLRYSTAIVCCLSGIALYGQSRDSRDLSAQVDEVVRAQIREQHIPGVSLAVMRDGKIIKAAAYGFANLELKVPLTAEMLFKSGSLVKQFTATSIMMLVEEGKVGLDDEISKYLPEAPASWKGVTIRRLLTHTSRIRDFFGEDGDRNFDPHRDYSEDEWIRLFSAQSMRRIYRHLRPDSTFIDKQSGSGLQCCWLKRTNPMRLFLCALMV